MESARSIEARNRRARLSSIVGALTIIASITVYCFKRSKRGLLRSSHSIDISDEDSEITSRVAGRGPIVLETGADTGEDGESNLQKTIKRAKYMFPGIVGEQRSFQSTQHVKRYLNGSVQYTLDNMSLESRETLMKRAGAAELCIAIGMDKVVVGRRFKAIANFEREIGATGKTHILHSISLLISTIDIDNHPFGRATDQITDNFKDEESLSYLGVNLKRDSLVQTMETVVRILKEKGFDKKFMRGTKGRFYKRSLIQE